MHYKNKVLMLLLLALCVPVYADLDDTITDLSSATTHLGGTLGNALVSINADRGILMVVNVADTTPGSTVDLPVTLLSSTFSITSLQGDVALPDGIILNSVTAGPAALAAGKQVQGSGNKFLVFGLNQTPIQNGVIAILHLAIPNNQSPTLCPISIEGPVASDAQGNAVIVSVVSGTLAVK